MTPEVVAPSGGAVILAGSLVNSYIRAWGAIIPPRTKATTMLGTPVVVFPLETTLITTLNPVPGQLHMITDMHP